EVALATAGATVITLALFLLGWGHRSGRTQILRRPAEAAARSLGLPVWAALPTQIASGALLVALFGMYWDISLHIDVGRDPGPLANPAHFFILAGLFGLFVAGFLAVVLPEGRPSRASVRVTGDWYAPIAGIALVAARTYAGRGAALGAAVYFIVIRGIVTLLVGPVLGETTPHMPLYLVEAGLVEAAALVVPPARAYRFGALCGLLIGTIGF